MVRLFLFMCGLLLALSSSIIVVRAVGSAGPNTALSMFSNPDGSICQRTCLFGIQPGETTVGEAIARLKSHPMLRNARIVDMKTLNLGMDTVEVFAQGMNIAMGRTNDELVDWISINLLPMTVLPITNLGNVMAILGSPSSIYTDDLVQADSYVIPFQLERAEMLFAAKSNDYSRGFLDPRDAIVAVMFVSRGNCADYKSRLVSWPIATWLGGASETRYVKLKPSLVTHRQLKGAGTIICVVCDP